MATRSTVAFECGDGSIEQIYVHWDGYISWNGKILFNHYQDPKKIRDLISCGACSVLAEEIGRKHEFDKSHDGICKFYHRDRGDELQVHRHPSFEHYQNHGNFEEYDYIYRKGEWLVSADSAKTFVRLEDALKLEQEENVFPYL